MRFFQNDFILVDLVKYEVRFLPRHVEIFLRIYCITRLIQCQNRRFLSITQWAGKAELAKIYEKISTV